MSCCYLLRILFQLGLHLLFSLSGSRGSLDFCDDKLTDVYRTDRGRVSFVSDASLETIRAASKELKGVIDPESRKLAFSLPVASFEGFNSPLQRVHFNENYLQTALYPEATFEAKIIEKIDLNVNGVHKVTAVGKFNIHGIVQEKKVEAVLTQTGRNLLLKASLDIVLADYNILIPKVVEYKIAKSVKVEVEATLSRPKT